MDKVQSYVHYSAAAISSTLLITATNLSYSCVVISVPHLSAGIVSTMYSLDGANVVGIHMTHSFVAGLCPMTLTP